MADIVELPPESKRAVCEAIAEGLPHWIQAEADTPGKANRHVALDAASLAVLERATDIMVEAAHQLEVVAVEIRDADIEDVVANRPRQVRYRLKCRIALTPPKALPRHVEVLTDDGWRFVRPVIVPVRTGVVRIRPQVMEANERHGMLSGVARIDRVVPLKAHPEDYLPPANRELLLATVKAAVELTRGRRTAHTLAQRLYEEVQVWAWSLRDRWLRPRLGLVEVVSLGTTSVMLRDVAVAGGAVAPQRASGGPTEPPTMREQSFIPNVPAILEDLVREAEEAEAESIADALQNIRDISDATRGNPQAWTDHLAAVQRVVERTAEAVAADLAERGRIADVEAWINAAFEAANATMRVENETRRDQYMTDVRRRLGKHDGGFELLRHARVAAIARRPVTGDQSSGEQAIIDAAREADALRRKETLPRPLNLQFDGWLELLVQLDAALAAARLTPRGR